jgi:hypothetical protein
LHARAQTPFLAVFLGAICLLGMLSVLAIQSSPATPVALFLICGALGVVILKPTLALSLLVLSRFTFEMAWDQGVGSLGMLDILGAGVPVAVLIVVLLRQPRFAHLPLVKASLIWSAVLWAFAGVYVLAGGDALMTLENTMRFSSGIPLFLLTVIVVRDFRHALLIFGFWAIAAVPVAIVFYAYGEQDAMSYHGVLRLRALYHDVVTPAVVACMALHVCLFFFALGRLRAWSHVRLAGLAIASILLARMLFLTFHNGLTAVAFLMGFVIAVIRRQHGMILAALALLLVMTQIPDVQRRWWREIAIVQGEHDPIGFASGRPNRWRRFLARWDDEPLMERVIGVHGAWGNPENQLLQLLVDQGIFVGLFTLGFLTFVLRSMIRWRKQCDDPERRLFYATVIGFLVGSLAAWVTATPLAFTNFQWILWCLTGLAAAVHHKDPGTAPEPEVAPAAA